MHKKEWNNAMDGPRDYHTEWSKPDKNIIGYHLYVEPKKCDANEFVYKI